MPAEANSSGIEETNMEVIGKATIHPVLFYSGKIAGYIAFLALPVQMVHSWVLTGRSATMLELLALIPAVLGLALVALSWVNLGKSLRLGLPGGKTEFKMGGLYRFSRNPMYLGFDLLTVSGIVFTVNPIVLALGLYSMVVYHLIIKAEERFLTERFGGEYLSYTEKVRRYL
jgi:protein-S-isoprenylcysteine O-methyltransferase Ste14